MQLLKTMFAKIKEWHGEMLTTEHCVLKLGPQNNEF